MKIEKQFQDGLIKLINKKKLDEINVISLCEFVGSNRQTFYYHYRDISDVVESIFLESDLSYKSKLSNVEEILKGPISYINKNFKFMYEISNSFAAEKIESMLYTFMYKHTQLLIKDDKKADRKNVARYIANLYTKELVFWINTKRVEDQNKLINRLAKIGNYFLVEYNEK